MTIPFYKYQGTGNDFVVIDNRTNVFGATKPERVAALCHRRFGIGADGLILLQNHAQHDFEMMYFNSDGHPSSMCGNGGRCIVAFAHFLGIVGQSTTFLAVDGPHDATIENGHVRLKMADVASIERLDADFWLNTGSPHFVRVVADAAQHDIVQTGRAVRYSDGFAEEGTNVNVLQRLENGRIAVRTYERGVEDETLSCGTGVTACALVAQQLGWQGQAQAIEVQTQGGQLAVEATPNGSGGYANVWLSGPAVQVFKGELHG